MFTSPAYSQEIITTAILDPIWVAPDTVLPILSTDILSSAEASSSISAEVNKTLPDSATMAGYLQKLNDITGNIDTIYLGLEGLDKDEIGSKLLQNYQNQLSLLQTDINSFKDILDNKSKELLDQWKRMDFTVKAWELTLLNTEPEPLTESLVNRSELILTDVTQTRDDLTTLGNEIIRIGDQILTANQRLEKLTTQMLETEEMVRLNYLKKTHPALWEKDTLPPDSISISMVFNSTRLAYKNGFQGFYNAYKSSLYFIIFLFIALLVISFIIRKKVKKLEANENNEQLNKFLKIFKNPVAVSLTLGIFFTFMLYPGAPQIIRDFASVLIVIPLLVVAMQVLPKRLHLYLLIISALFLFVRIMDIFKYGNYPLPSFLILGVLLTTTALIVWMIIDRFKKYRSVEHKKVRWIDIYLWTSLGIMLASLIFHIFGYVAFGFFFFNGFIISLLAAVLIYVCVVIIEGFFNLIILGSNSETYGILSEYGAKLVNRIITVVKLIGLIYWFRIALNRFLIFDVIMGWFQDILDFKWVVNDMTFSFKGILLFILIIYVSVWIARFLKLLLDKEVFPRVKLSRGIPGIIGFTVRFAIVTIGLIIAFTVLGINLDKLTILIGALGVGIGFGLQDIMNNLISGFILIFERPIQVGDTIQFGDKEGIVQEIGIRSSNIKTYNGSEVIVPNGKLISNELINLTLSDHVARVEINVGTEYGSDPQEVIDILVMQAKLHDKVAKNPEAFAIFFGYGDYALNFRLYAYTTYVNSRLSIRSELNLAIFQALKEADITIPYPIQDLNLNIDKSEEPKENKKKPETGKK